MTAAESPISITLCYAQKSRIEAHEGATRVLLALDGSRGTVGLHAGLRDPGLFRDAIMTAATVLGSDLRHKSKDRTAYLAYLAKQGKKASAAIWQAHKDFLDEAFAEDKQKNTVLDPVLTVDPDELSLEIFSRDESSYLRLAFANSAFISRKAVHGTTFVDLSQALIEGMDALRSHGKVEIDAAATTAHIGPGPSQKEVRRDVQLSHGWLRGFLQVQSAATLSANSCSLTPIDLYNLLFALRVRKAKKSPRALRFELVPGSRPRMVLEPWEIVLECHGQVYAGKTPKVVRTFGRQRLMALARLLPHVRGAAVHLLGPGLPVFWVLDLGVASLTLGLTGWTESGWSSAASFDALMPGKGAAELADRVHALLLDRGPLPFEQMVDAGLGSPDSLRSALKLGCLRGRLVYDLSRGLYRPRELLAEPVDEQMVRYGSQREEKAHRLLGDGQKGEAEVRLTKIHDIVGEGIEVHGQIVDAVARRSYLPVFTLDLEGRIRSASCICPTFRRGGLREGPCEHLIALMLRYTRKKAEDEAMRQTPEGRRLIRAETRVLVRRGQGGEESVYRVSLDDRVVRLAFGLRKGEMRQQRLWFDTDREAREAYFARLDDLATVGYIEADSA